MLNGIDVSGWQSNMSFDKYDFVIIKATEGKTNVSDGLDRHYRSLSGKGDFSPCDKLYGFYHYAHPENNTAVEEAEHFLSVVSRHKGHALFALDWEGKALKCPVSWAVDFLGIVRSKMGGTPLIYTSGSEMRSGKYTALAQMGFGLWLAEWHDTRTLPTMRDWQTFELWQHTSKPYDLDLFNGDKQYFKMLVKGL